MAFYLKNIVKNIVMTEEDEENYGITNICRFCDNEKNFYKTSLSIDR